MPVAAIGQDCSRVENMLRQRPIAASLVSAAVRARELGRTLPAKPQDDTQAYYFSHPTPDTLAQMRRHGIELFRLDPVRDLLAQEFGPVVDEAVELVGRDLHGYGRP
ncbi:MAG TPA: hypothetical protein VK816_02475 [Jatrophihabitantaceae bacterium]|jgi:hypothetical protein|nr:hypothetical protein [Jatrophihabitantaceae bacterium]